jgi:signal transduction histidine kinase
MKIILKVYNTIYLWLVKDKLFSHPEGPDEVHRLLTAVMLTSVLMWSYSFNSYFFIDSNYLTLTAFTCTFIHFFAPLIYKFTNSILITVNVFIGVGFIFQYSHAFFTGGFYSVTVLWFSILPLIAGIILGKSLLIAWSLVAACSVASLLLLNEYTVDIITGFGRTWSHANIAFGYIIVNFVLMFLFIHMRELHKNSLANKNESIKKLLRIVSHDIANPLTIVMGRVRMIKKKMPLEPKKLEKYLDGIEKSSLMIKEILDHTRNLQAIESGIVDVVIVEITLNEIIENSLFVFKDKIEEKNIKINYNFAQHAHICLYADKVTIKNQVFNNLFSNSIKFMEENGEITITVEHGNDFIEVTFADSGQGMEPDVLKNIFRADVKTTKKGTLGEVGTGFGMPILHATLSDIGASIDVKSIPKGQGILKHGTEFVMRFINKIQNDSENNKS